VGPSERWRRVEDLCEQALALDSGERRAFLVEACGADEALRHEVESLLANATKAEDFLAPSALAAAAHVVVSSQSATLTGRRIGIYEIGARLGVGGMGEVYRAKDTRLGRDVAIKVLPAAFTADRERLARFEREAWVLASLNHPNIGAIYGVEEFEGLHALVLELVEGDTLAGRIAVRGSGLKVSDGLGIARQIAEALEAAHEKGIIHRDLKPANIKVTPTGTAKVLDFGLAKSGAGSVPDLPHSPTITIGGTRDGALLGTAAYMSPEQARGQVVDKRTDIWAFGCVLYEMLTGRIAFPGATVSDHIAAILERDPDWSALSRSTPPAIERLLRRCLEKDPKQRLHDIADARIEIDEELTGKTSAATSATPRGRRRSRRAAWAIATVLVAVATGWSAWQVGRSRGAPLGRSVTRFAIQPPDVGSFVNAYDISPDGGQLVYVVGQSPSRLVIRRFDQFDATPVAGTEGADVPFFSADGEWIAFFMADKLAKVNIRSNAPPVILRSHPDLGNRGGAWTDDAVIFTGRDAPLRQVSTEGGEPRPLTTLDPKTGEIDHHAPDVLPGGQVVLFALHRSEDRFSIVVESLASHQRKMLIESGFAPRYSTSGHIVFGRGTSVLAVPFDLGRLEVTGTPVTLVEHVATEPRNGLASFRLSKSGSLVFEPDRSLAGRKLVWVDRTGAETPLPIAPRAFWTARVSPDGKTLAFTAADGGRLDIWIYDIGSEKLTRITSEGENNAPMWTPDGRWLTFASNRNGLHHIIRQPADGSGVAESVVSSRDILLPGSWTADNRTLLYTDRPPTDKLRMFALHIDRASTSEPLGNRSFPSLSPDGRWLAFVSEETGQREVYVEAFPASGFRHQISVGGGGDPVWSRDGRTVFYKNRDDLFRVGVDRSRGFSAGKPERLFERQYVRADLDYDVAPTERFLMIKPSEEELKPSQLKVVVNWVDELARRVPSGVTR